ncbi:MAG: sialidase family protein [Pirellulales bacterium]
MTLPKLSVFLGACAVLVTVLSDQCAAEPLMEKTDLFVAGQGGYRSYRIPSLVVTPNGSLLAFCEARQTGGDWGPIEILMRRSADGGKNWSEPKKMAEIEGPHRKNPAALAMKLAGPDAVTQNNPLLIADAKTGAVHLLFCHEYMRCFYRRSDDDGQTFSKSVEITAAFEPFRRHYDWKVLATGPGHGVQLKSGRLIVPVWLSTGTGGGAHRPSVVTTLYSDDHGAKWQCGDIVAGETDPLVNPSEAEAIELADGPVLLNMRSESKQNRRAIAVSPDGAANWTRPALDDELVEPICMASLCRLSKESPDGKNRILFANPANLERAGGKAEPGKSRDRKNLTVRLSYDEAQSWPVAKTLESGPSAYSDLAVGPDGTIYCLYERSSRIDNVFAPSLTLARFNLEWLTDGKDKLSATAAVR